MRLGLGGANPFQCGYDGKIEHFSQMAGDFLGLVEKPMLPSPPVQRHGNQRPALFEGTLESRVVKGLGGDAREIARKMDGAAVLEMMDQFARRIAAVEHRTRERECIIQPRAIRADKAALDVSFEHLAALFATGFGNSRQVFVAVLAQVSSLLLDLVTDFAGRRK